MDQGRIYENLPVIALLLLLVGLQAVPPEFKGYMLFGGIGGVLIMMFGTEMLLRDIASKWLYILLIVRPSNLRLHLWIREPQEGLSSLSRRIDRDNPMYETKLDLGEAAQHPFYKKINQVILKHELPWEQRMMFMPGQAFFRGYRISHNKTATVVAWEPRNENAKAEIEFLKPIPVYNICEAPRDYYLVDEAPSPTGGNNYNSAGNQIQAFQTGQNEGTELRVQKAEAATIEEKRRWFNEHQMRIRLEGEVEELRNEFQGAISRVRDVSKLVLEELLTLLSAHTEIVEAVNEVRPRNWFKITMPLVILVLGFLGIYEFASNDALRAWISANTLLIIIIAVAAILVLSGYGLNRRRK